MVEFVEAVKTQPELLTSDQCPYPKEFTEIVRDALFKSKAKVAVTSSLEDIENQIAEIQEDLEDFRGSLNADEDGQIFVSFMRLKGQLLVKLVDVKERVYNAKKMKEFQDRVLKALDTLCTPEQKTRLIEILEGK